MRSRSQLLSVSGVKNLSDYMAAVDKATTTWARAEGPRFVPWFRGQSQADWPLQPRFHREEFARVNEDDFRFEFKHKAGPFLVGQALRPQTEWDWYFLMQHYGLPTRLLDWTEGSLVALFFAVQNNDPEDNPAVWLLNPHALNRASGTGAILTAADRKVLRHLHPTYASKKTPARPLAIRPAYNSFRISSQRGLFTIHGSDQRPLDQYPFLKSELARLDIDQRSVRRIRKQLALAGITQASLFPELASLSRDIVSSWLD
jgi:hypothetical protein